MLVARHCIPNANLQGELGEQLHVVNAFQNFPVHIEGILGITEFLNAVVLTAKILVDGAARVIGSTIEVGDFANVGSAERCETLFEGLEHFNSRCMMCIFVIREEVHDNSVRDHVNDVEDTSKIGDRLVCKGGGGPVVLGLGNVDLGNVVGVRGLV